ncbi:MAG: hypothetical protein AAGA66_19415 [Bacteroidota bacterium]
MKKIALLITLAHMLLMKTSAQEGLPFKDLSKIEGVSVTYYVNPLRFSFGACEGSYQPDWLKAYYAMSNPRGFEDYPNEAINYYHESLPRTKERLQAFEQKILNADSSDFPRPYMYVFGEIQFQLNEKGASQEFIMTFAYKSPTPLEESFNIDFSLMQQPQLKSGVSMLIYLKEEGVWKVPEQRIIEAQLIGIQ